MRPPAEAGRRTPVSSAYDRSVSATVRVGTCSWADDALSKYFYPPKLPAKVIDKITGVSAFKGKYNHLVWTDKWQAML